MRWDWVKGLTNERVYQLLNDDVPVLIQGSTVTLVLRDAAGTPSTFVDPKVIVLDDGTLALRGHVQVKLAATDLVAGAIYTMRFLVNDGSDEDFWPDDATPDFLIVGSA